MKEADTGFFTKHLEKIILGTGLLVLLIICLVFVVGSPYQVNVRTGVQNQAKGPGEIESAVHDQAETLRKKLHGKAGVKKPKIPDYVKNFNDSLNKPFHSMLAYGAWNDRNPPDIIEGPKNGGRKYQLPRPPMPLSVTAHADHGVLNFKRIGNPNVVSAYHQMVGNEQPADFRYVSVSGTFNKKKWAQRFGEVPDKNQLPERMYRRNIFLTGVYLIRQTQDPISNQWGHTRIIKPLPGQIAYLPDQPRNLTPRQNPYSFTPGQGRQAKQKIRQNQPRIALPAFPPLLGFNPWTAPDAPRYELSTEQQNKLFQIKQKIKSQQKLIDRLENRDENGAARNRPDNRGRDRPRRDERDRRGRRGRRGAGPGGPGGEPGLGEEAGRYGQEPGPGAAGGRYARNRPNGNGGAGSNDPKQARLNRLYKQLNKLKKQRDKLEPRRPRSQRRPGEQQLPPDVLPGDELPGGEGYRPQDERPDQGRYNQPRRGRGRARPGQGQRPRRGRGQRYPSGQSGQPGQGPYPPDMNPQNPGSGQSSADREQKPSGQIKIWAHDLTVQPNRTYRYKIVATTYNPLFQRRQLSPEQVKENKNRIALAPTVNEMKSANWSKPVHVSPKYYFYVVGGSANDNRAQVEVYRLYGGRWRMEEFDAKPGDSIGDIVEINGPDGTQNVDMRVGAYMVDMESVPGAGPGGQLVRMLYLDPLTDRIRSRGVAKDRDNPQRQRLHSLTQQRSEARAEF